MAYTDFGFMRPEGGGDGDGNIPIPIETRRKMAEDERQKYLAFMQHPSYKKRLLMEMYGKEANPDSAEQQQALEQEYGRREKTVSNIPIKFKRNIPYLGQTIPGEEDARRILLSEDGEMASNPDQFQDVVRHEFGHAVNNAILGRGGNNMNPVEGIIMQQSRPGRKAMSELMAQFSSDKGVWDKGEKQKAIRDATKEFGAETVNKVLKLRKQADQDIGLFKKRTIDEWPEFNKILDRDTFESMYQNPTEFAARLGNIRRIAAEKFGHDMNEDFDIKKYGPQIEQFYRQKNVKSPYKDLREQGFSDEAINEMMKYIARVPQQQSTRYTG